MITYRVSAVLLLMAMLAGPLAQAQNSRAQSEVTLRELEQKLAAASSSNDWQFWDQVVAPEWTFIDQYGRTWDKPAILAMFKNFKGSIQSAKFYDVQVRFFKDDVAMVTGTLTIGSVPGKTVKAITRITDILVERGGKWLVVASQATPVKELR
ncbi:MAG TPA: nuclear transport factor 2 family protein [Candidatus Angelobacter sp.]|nr:nuclear transport factor 2 family protein [Candidatus Angelobacter sp.]